MCIAIPKQIRSIETIDDMRHAIVTRQGQSEKISLVMTPQAEVGDTVLVFQGNAIRVVSETEAQQIEAALACLGDALAGESIEDGLRQGFGDLIDNPGQLPPHLPSQVGKKVL